MLTDRFNKEIKVGDAYLYPVSGGRGSGYLSRYTVTKIEPYPVTEYRYELDEDGKIKFDERNRAIKYPVEVTHYRFMAVPAEGGRQVRLNFPERGLVVTGINLHHRYGEPPVPQEEEAAHAA